jgi:hypothetical protein
MNDFRYAFRTLSKQRSFFVVAVVILGLGIGANTAIFSVVNAVLLKPLVYKDPESLVMVWGIHTQNPDGARPVSLLNFEDWKARNTVFEKMAGSSDGAFNLTGVGDPESLQGYRFDKDFFDLLGITPMLGRTFLAEETQAGRNQVAVLGHGLWCDRRYAAGLQSSRELRDLDADDFIDASGGGARRPAGSRCCAAQAGCDG